MLDIKIDTIILLTQSAVDPSTGLSRAFCVLEEIKKNKILVVTEGDGHTRLPLSGKIAEAIVQYLVIGKAPSPGLVLDSLTNTAAPIVVVKLGGIRKTADDYSYMRS
jgi:hypothetical protein